MHDKQCSEEDKNSSVSKRLAPYLPPRAKEHAGLACKQITFSSEKMFHQVPYR